MPVVVRRDPWGGYGGEIADSLRHLEDYFCDNTELLGIDFQIFAEYSVNNPCEKITYYSSELEGETVKITPHFLSTENKRYKCGRFRLSDGDLFPKRSGKFDEDYSNTVLKSLICSSIDNCVKNDLPNILSDPNFVLNQYRFANLPEEVYPTLSFSVVGISEMCCSNEFKEKTEVYNTTSMKPLKIDVVPSKKHAFFWDIKGEDLIFNLNDWKDEFPNK